jgi:hypothetical protein
MISKICCSLRTPLTIGLSVVASMLSAFLTGCVTTATVTHRDTGFSGHPTRIFIVSDLADLGYGFEDELQKRMIPDIESCGGHAVFDRVSLELNQDEEETRIDQFKADIVLMMQLPDIEPQDGLADVDSEVWDVSTKKVVWRANTELPMVTAALRSTRVEAFHKDLMAKLRQDGMVPACDLTPQSRTGSK